MTHDPDGPRESAAAATSLLSKASGLRRRGGRERLATAAVLEAAAVRLIGRFVEGHLGAVATRPAKQRRPRDHAPSVRSV